MGRPRIYKTEEERRQARKAQNRVNIRNHRLRRKLEPGTKTKNTLTIIDCAVKFERRHDPAIPDKKNPQEIEEVVRLHNYSNTPLQVPDLARHSDLPLIDLYPDFMQTMAANLQSIHQSWPYLQIVEELGLRHDWVRLGTFALGATYFGHMKQDGKMISWSKSAYRDLLPQIRTLLTPVPTDPQAGLVLCALNNAVMGIEMVNCAMDESLSSKHKWLMHMRAKPRIFEACGAQAFQSALGRNLLRATRPLFVLEAVHYGGRVFMDDEDWRRLPWRGTDMTLDDQLWNIIDRIPTWLKRCRASHSTSKEEIASAYQAFVALQDDLNAWFNDFEACHGCSVDLHIHHLFSSSPVIDPTPYDVEFIRQLNIYWSYIFLIGETVIDLQQRYPEAPFLQIPRESDMLVVADRLYRTFKYLLVAASTDIQLVSWNISWPNRMLIRYFEKDLERYVNEWQRSVSFEKHLAKIGLNGKMGEFVIDCYEGVLLENGKSTLEHPYHLERVTNCPQGVRFPSSAIERTVEPHLDVPMG